MVRKTRSFKVITLGCKVNQYESASLKGELLKAGWSKGKEGEESDVVVVNTCIVTQRAAHQSRQAIRKAVRENPDGMVAAVGCYAQLSPDELLRIEGVDLVAGNTMKGQLPSLLMESVDSRKGTAFSSDFKPDMRFEFQPLDYFSGRNRAYLKIQDGCQSFCSYCIVPFVRGPYRSLSQAKVLSMLESLAGNGYKEIVLTGIHLGKYGVDLRESGSLNGLLRAIGKEAFPLRIRLSSIEPLEIETDLIAMVASEAWLCRHFHIPLQSGDDGILRRMNRKYTARDFSRLVAAIHQLVPDVAIGVDILSGFPGEGEAAHVNTVSMVRDLPVSYLHVFPFSPRAGTPAASYDGQHDPKVIKRRAAELREIGQRKRVEFYRACLGKEYEVLAEERHSEDKNMMKGTSDNYMPVIFPSSQAREGQFVCVHMEEIGKKRVLGSVKGAERRPPIIA